MRFHPFPDDLVTAQRSWTATYEELAHPHATSTTLLRRRLLRLSVQLHFHPYWAHPRPAAGRAELRQLVREQRASRGRTA
ncbi:hypothetical protein AMK27_03635 [Streptomyces sp. CB02009]|uniref:hypothetical protein n=1 Tax=Streptomyces sp. CB02009 TaxID=1703938 RepID=UPI00093C1949|nr:hypothetical protein [Streptomyces sp. CB02009]OKJ64956.1 hypothetical protein AMK27_03635 [Streptomyces sp. CB02009]